MHYSDRIKRDTSQQLALQVDGLPLHGAETEAYNVQAVVGNLSSEERTQLEAVRAAVGPDIGIIDSYFDDIQPLLEQLGFRVDSIASEDLGTTNRRVVVMSCPHRHARLDQVDLLQHMDKGGVLLSSDRAIRLPGIAGTLGHLPGRRPSRARLAMSGCNEQATLAPVWLDPGHLSIDPTTIERSGGTILATNSLTDEPLAVAVTVGNGALIHSVPHWIQIPHPDELTSVERRRLRDVPEFRHIGNSYPGITFGSFLAQRAMITLLIRGLASAAAKTTLEDHSNARRGE